MEKAEKQLKNLVPYKIDKRITKLELWAEGKSKEAKNKTVVTKAVVVDKKFLAKHLTPKEAKKK